MLKNKNVISIGFKNYIPTRGNTDQFKKLNKEYNSLIIQKNWAVIADTEIPKKVIENMKQVENQVIEISKEITNEQLRNSWSINN